MNDFFKKNRVNIIIILVFLVLPFIFFKDAFKLNSVILGSGDPTASYIPLRQLKVELIKNFELPFWNKYIFSGFPYLSDIPAIVFYPIIFILDLFFPIVVAYNLSLLIHYSFAGIFLYLFLNEYKLDKIASFTAGIIFMFSGAMISHRSHPNIIYGMVWIPLILLFLEKYRKSKKIEFVFIASIFYSISFFGSHPQIFLYGSMIILIFIFYYALIYDGLKNYSFLFSLIIFVVGFLIISIQSIPIYELIKNSSRASLDYNYFSSFSFSPKMTPILFFPFLFGNPFYQLQNVPTYFGPWNYTEMIIYFGIATIPLLVFGFFSKNKHKYVWIFLLIFSFFLVLGNHTPLYKLMYYIPLFNKFRVPARNWFEFGLAFSILTGFGFDYFLKLSKEKIRKIILSLLIFFGAVLSTFFIFYFLLQTKLKENLISFLGITGDYSKYLLQNVKLGNYSIFIPLIVIFCTILILALFLFKKNKFLHISLILLIILDLVCFNYFYESNSDTNYLNNKIEELQDLRFLKQEDDSFRLYPVATGISGIILLNNKNIHQKIDVITGYSGAILNDYRFITGINESSDANTDWVKLLKNNNILSILNTKYIIIPMFENMDEFKDSITRSYWKDVKPVLDKIRYGEAEFTHSWLTANKVVRYYDYETVYANDTTIVLENKNFIPRFHFIEEVIDVNNLVEVKNILWEEAVFWEYDKFDVKTTALVQDVDFSRINFNAEDANVSVIEYKNNKVTLETTSKDDSFLIFSDTYYPGWKAYIDNIETRIYRTNGITKGIYIPEGKHIIVFEYVPNYFWIGAITSLSIFILMVAGIIILFIRHKKSL